jgi:hypothetical protein
MMTGRSNPGAAAGLASAKLVAGGRLALPEVYCVAHQRSNPMHARRSQPRTKDLMESVSRQGRCNRRLAALHVWGLVLAMKVCSTFSRHCPDLHGTLVPTSRSAVTLKPEGLRSHDRSEGRKDASHNRLPSPLERRPVTMSIVLSSSSCSYGSSAYLWALRAEARWRQPNGSLDVEKGGSAPAKARNQGQAIQKLRHCGQERLSITSHCRQATDAATDASRNDARGPMPRQRSAPRALRCESNLVSELVIRRKRRTRAS